MNTKFWKSAKPGDDICVFCHQDDIDQIADMLKPIDFIIKTLGPFTVYTSSYVKHGTVLFLNKTEHKKVWMEPQLSAHESPETGDAGAVR